MKKNYLTKIIVFYLFSNEKWWYKLNTTQIVKTSEVFKKLRLYLLVFDR